MGSLLSHPENEEEQSLPHKGSTMESQSLQPKRLRNARVTILSEILETKVRLDENLVKENNKILHSFLDSFIDEMKKHDALFALLFRNIYYTGSFYADMRVSVPNEFDLNLVLKMPKGQDVTYNSQVPSYAKFKLLDENILAKDKSLAKLFQDGFIIPSKVRTWIQSVVARALKTYRCPPGITKVDNGAAGPARTLTLHKINGDIIDIDFVPAIECSPGLKPPGIYGPVYAKVKNDLQCFLVPKPLVFKPGKQPPINESEQARLWRAHYPEAEKKIIHDLQCVKNIVKLLKMLRDKEKWKIIASYYLKTIIMWMILNHPDDPKTYWRLDNMGDRFMDALRELAKCIKERKISYFFSNRCNLLEKLTEAEAFNIHNRLLYIIRKIEEKDSYLWELFGCEPTFVI